MRIICNFSYKANRAQALDYLNWKMSQNYSSLVPFQMFHTCETSSQQNQLARSFHTFCANWCKSDASYNFTMYNFLQMHSSIIYHCIATDGWNIKTGTSSQNRSQNMHDYSAPYSSYSTIQMLGRHSFSLQVSQYLSYTCTKVEFIATLDHNKQK
jgi:hypothetical protein